MAFSDEDKILIKSLHLKGYTANRLTDKCPDKSWTKCVVKKLLKKLRDTGIVDRRPGSGRPCSEKKIAMLSYAYAKTTTVLRPFVRDYSCELVPEETLTHPPS